MQLDILWQRLVKGAETCKRCGDTGASVRRAAARLAELLAPRGIAVSLTEKTLPPLALSVGESNRIYFNGQALEELLGAKTGMNHCQSCCELLGERTDCRTLVLDGCEYEVLPEELLVRAGLAAAESLQPTL